MKRNRYPLTELIKRWQREELTSEQAIGQMLLWLTNLSQRVEQLENIPSGQAAGGSGGGSK